jgi:hypothetical protein
MSRFFPFNPPGPVPIRASPSDTPLGFHLDLVGNMARIRFVYSAGSDEPLAKMNTPHVSVGIGINSLRLFQIEIDLSSAPTMSYEAFATWCTGELDQALATLRMKEPRSGPRMNYELASQGLRDGDQTPAWMISALEKMRGADSGSGHRSH